MKTFKKGGVHPDSNKHTANKEIKVLPLPKTVTIPISQHIGAPAKAVVKKKDTVKTGQIIAKSSDFVSANIHSPVSGTVTKIGEFFDTSGYKKQAITIKVEGDDWESDIDCSPELIKEIKMSQQEIIKKVGDAGIVGLGGATFPSHVKLSVPKKYTAEVLIINGAECEPYLTADHRVMLEKADELMVGTKIIMKALNVDRAIIGIEKNKPDAIAKLEQLTSSYAGIEIMALKEKYPQGGEKQLIKACIKREVPSGKLPIAVGAVVHNVGTAIAVYEAVQKNKPLFERVLTLTGTNVKQPGNFLVRIGTSIDEVIAAGGGLPENTGKVIAGGPMMGKALNTTDVPVTKGTSGILILSQDEAYRKKEQNCIRCAKCTEACPMGLEPFLLRNLSKQEIYETAEQEHIMDCIECGSCSYTCPAHIPLLDYIRLGKQNVGKIIRARKN